MIPGLGEGECGGLPGPCSAGLVATCIEKTESQRGKVTCPGAHSEFTEEAGFQAQDSRALFTLLTHLAELNPEFHSEKPAQSGGRQRKRVRAGWKVCGSSLSRDGTVEPGRDPSLGQLAHLCLHEPVQSRGQRWGQLFGLCHGFLGRISPKYTCSLYL